jgi:polar amino acid transport system substrate-binding protein
MCLAAGGTVLLHGAARAASLSVCIDASSPAASRDQRIAVAVAKQQHSVLSMYHFDGSSSDDDGVNARAFRALAAGHCQLVLGYPMDATNGTVPPGLAPTSPYDQTGFVLVVEPPAIAAGLADLPKGSDVAVTYMAAPNLYFLHQDNVQADIEHTDRDTLQTLLDGKVKAAMVWQATLTQFVAEHPTARLNYRLLDEPHARWNVVALFGAQSAPEAAAFDRSIAALRHDGTLPDILVPPRERHAEVPFIQPAAYQMKSPIIDAAQGHGGGAPAPAEGAALPALYTQDQADSGLSKYSAYCAQCHGAAMQGRSGPSLKGKNFATKKAAFTVSDVFHIVSQNMPATQPGSLAHDDYVEIMAFLLQENGYPAGKTALTFDSANASKTPLLYHGQ